jgi:hypothetical protein
MQRRRIFMVEFLLIMQLAGLVTLMLTVLVNGDRVDLDVKNHFRRKRRTSLKVNAGE